MSNPAALSNAPMAENRRSPFPSAPGTAPTSPSKRRVLGELTPNARRVASPLRGQTPLKPLSNSPSKRLGDVGVKEKENIGAGPGGIETRLEDRKGFAGRKRRIDEVEGGEEAVRQAYGRPLAPTAPSVSGSARRSVTPTPATRTMQAPAQRPGPMPYEHRPINARDFYDEEELSATDADSPEPEIQPFPKATTSRRSFSSLIDYDPRGTSSSQPASSSPPLGQRAKQQVDAAAAAAATTGTVPTGRDEKAVGSAKLAQTLKLRLQVALYKVRTNQTTVPMSQLQMPSAETTPTRHNPQPEPQLSTPSRSGRVLQESSANTQTQRNARSHITNPPVPRLQHPTDANIAPASAAATAASDALKLLPAPVLKPTAYSTRFITEQDYVRSSPPGSPAVDGSSRSSNRPRKDSQETVTAGEDADGEDDTDLPSSTDAPIHQTPRPSTAAAAGGLLELMRSS